VSSLRATATVAMFPAPAFGDTGAGADEPAGPGGGFLRRLHRGPADQGGALRGDRATMHGGVGFAVSWGQPGPRAQVPGTGEPVYVADFGDEDRRQGRSHPGDDLDRSPLGGNAQVTLTERVAGVACMPESDMLSQSS
jgi:hypothetical protein